MFCKHDWKILSETVTKSKFECAIDALKITCEGNFIMSDCQCCPVEKQCDYECKPCDCVHQRKFVQVVLKPYQVGDNDIVLAKDEDSAKQILVDYCDIELDEIDSVEDLSARLNIPFHDEEGNQTGTLGSWIKSKKEPQYIVGWE